MFTSGVSTRSPVPRRKTGPCSLPSPALREVAGALGRDQGAAGIGYQAALQ
jgi:hypothetical protein